MAAPTSPLFVVQHTSGEFLGLMEDHLEGRGIRFVYSRPFTVGGQLPATLDYTKGLVLLGGGPWGTGGGRAVPSLLEELDLTRRGLALDKPVIGIGLGAQILSLAAGGERETSVLELSVTTASRVDANALNGYLPERFPLVTYMRDRPVPPMDARVLAEDEAGRPAVFQVRGNCLGFVGHPGAKAGMIEDLIMEFDETPEDPGPALALLRDRQREIEDALVSIMTGLVQVTGLMRP